ncbi:MAG: hypothetical protein HOH74_22485, partial [Gemmatimonadetes bacterium]|nr:hypothetical protein [Gemmatimonadota bacterium]
MMRRHTCRWILLLGFFCALPSQAQIRTLILGDRLAPWSEGGPPGGVTPIRLRIDGSTTVLDTGNTPDRDIEFDQRPGWISPAFFDGSVNISARVLDPPGRIRAPNVLNVGVDLLRAQLEGTINGDHTTAFERKPTVFQPIMPAFGIIVQLDFGRLVGLDRVVFYPRDTVVPNSHYPFAADYLRGYELWLNDEIPTPTSGTPDRLIARTSENAEPVVELSLPAQYARIVKLRSLSPAPFEIDEIEVYGSGYFNEAVYYTNLIDLGDRATIGPIRWTEEAVGRPEFSEMHVRMRTGDDLMPLVFFERSVFLGELPEEITAE